jgi:protein SCO1/2
MRKYIIFALLAGAAVLGAGSWLMLQDYQRSQQRLDIAGIYLNEPRPLSEFTLTDSADKPFSRDSFKDHWSFLSFGYTYCPDACPLTLSQLNLVDKQLAEEDLNKDTDYLLISVDPRRDTPQRLAEYTAFFNKKFHGATGEPGELSKLSKALGVYYSVPENPEDPENYLVDHSSAVVLINPDAELQALFTPPHDPQRISADFKAIRERYEATN